MKNGKLVITLGSLLLVSLFAAAFALADDSVTIEDLIATENAESAASIVQEGITTTELSNMAGETESIAPTVKAAQQRYAGVARITAGDGFEINSGNTRGERVAAYWVSARYISVDPSIVKNLTKQYKGQPEKLKAELAKLATDKVVLKATGQISIGFGNTKEKFKLLKKEFTNTSVSFYVLPINTNLAELKDASDEDINAKAVGTLKLDATKYPHLTLWNGTLTLNSGNYADTWTLTAYSHSKTIAKNLLGKNVISKQQGERAQVVKPTGIMKGLLNKLAFWRKTTANTETA